MDPENKAKELGIPFSDDAEKGYLNMVVSYGNMLITSGHVSKIKGKLGDDLNVDQGYIAAKECGIWILQSIHQKVGSLNNIKVLKFDINDSFEYDYSKLVGPMVYFFDTRYHEFEKLTYKEKLFYVEDYWDAIIQNQVDGKELLNEFYSKGIIEIEDFGDISFYKYLKG